jgi:hypothetical protein
MGLGLKSADGACDHSSPGKKPPLRFTLGEGISFLWAWIFERAARGDWRADDVRRANLSQDSHSSMAGGGQNGATFGLSL